MNIKSYLNCTESAIIKDRKPVRRHSMFSKWYPDCSDETMQEILSIWIDSVNAKKMTRMFNSFFNERSDIYE